MVIAAIKKLAARLIAVAKKTAARLVAVAKKLADRLSYKPAVRSIELYEMGMSRGACTLITGVDPLQARHESLVMAGMWGALMGCFALAAVMAAWGC